MLWLYPNFRESAMEPSLLKVMLSWTWNYSVQTVVTSLARWCKNSGLDPKTTYVWQCALCG